jgi:hypothetical protein
MIVDSSKTSVKSVTGHCKRPGARRRQSRFLMSAEQELLGADVQKMANVASFVDDDLLSCFLWAAGENAVAQPGWESPSVTPLRGIPLPPEMELLPDAAPSGPPPKVETKPPPESMKGGDDDDEFDVHDDDIDDISRMGGPLTKEQKLAQRMQRKAESARIARLRKKDYVGGLEHQIKELTAALAAARHANQQGAAAGGAVPSASPAKAANGSAKKPAAAPSAAPDRLEVHGTVESFVANKRKQQETINEYLDCIEDMLTPSAPLQVAFNTPAEDKGAEGEAGAEMGEREVKRQRGESVSVQLTRELTVELGLTAEQVDGLARLQREFVKPDKEVVADCCRLLRQLRVKLTEHMDASQRMTDSMRRILSNEQVPKYLDWVSRRHTSMMQLSLCYE